MPFSKPRTDVRKALEEALASGFQVKLNCFVIYRAFEETGWVKSMAADRIVLGHYKEEPGRVSAFLGVPIMISDIREVSFWEEPREPKSHNPNPEPVGDPPPRAGSPGKREKVPEPEKKADAMAKS